MKQHKEILHIKTSTFLLMFKELPQENDLW